MPPALRIILAALVAAPFVASDGGAQESPRAALAASLGLAAAPAASLPEGVPFIVRFQGDVGGLQVGSLVTVKGLQVGTVREIAVVIDSTRATIDVPVVIDVVPERIDVDGTRPTDPASVYALAERLVANGLRAALETTTPLGGTQRVALAFDPDAAPAVLGRAGRHPEIPTAPTLGQELTTTLEALLARLAALPLEPMADDAAAVLARLRAMVTGPEAARALAALGQVGDELVAVLRRPEIGEALAALAAAAGDGRDLVAGLDARLTPAIAALQRAAGSIESAARDGSAAVVGLERSVGARSPLWDELLQTTRELAGTTRALRLLVEYLERHPDALLRGRPETRP